MSTELQTAPEVVTFGPYSTIGLRYGAGNGKTDFSGVWGRFVSRIGEIAVPKGAKYFGFCRCIPGAIDGHWEYIAAVETTDPLKVPDEMIRVDIPAGEYAVMQVEGLAQVGEAWKSIQKGVAELSGYEPYCGKKGCDCANHPSFEYYPPEFPQSKRLYIYVALKRA